MKQRSTSGGGLPPSRGAVRIAGNRLGQPALPPAGRIVVLRCPRCRTSFDVDIPLASLQGQGQEPARGQCTTCGAPWEVRLTAPAPASTPPEPGPPQPPPLGDPVAVLFGAPAGKALL